MKRVAKGLLGLAVTMGLVAAAQAGDISRHNDVQNFEIAGFGGWTVGGEFKWDGGGAIVNGELTGTGTRVGLDDHLSFAVAADLRASDSTAYELFYSHEGATQLKVFDGLASTDVSVSYLHLGGTLNLDESDRPIRPYALGGLGITRLSPGDTDGSSRTRPSASLGMGLRWAATQHLAVRLEGRGFVTFMKDNAVFCKSDDMGLLCRVHGNGTFIQGQFLLGAAFTF